MPEPRYVNIMIMMVLAMFAVLVITFLSRAA